MHDRTRGGFARNAASVSRVVFLLGALLTLMCLVLVVYPPSLIKSLERVGYDEMVRLLPAAAPPPEVVVVDVDERTLSTLGQWPWPRYRIAELIEHAAACGARSVVLDFFFSEPDRLSLNAVSDQYRRDRGLTVGLEGVPSDALDNDRLLAQTVARHKAILAADLQFGKSAAGTAACGKPLNVVLHALPGTVGSPPVPQAQAASCPLPILAEAAGYVAAANSLRDEDGIIRRAPLVLRVGEQWVPGLALAAVLTATGRNDVVIQWSSAGVLELRVGQTVIPTDYQGNLLLPFRGRPSERLEHISAVDLLEGRVEPGRINGRIVFIGASASGLQDVHATPVMNLCPGIDLHALAADAILRQDFLVAPGWSLGVQVVVVAVAGLLVMCLVAWTHVAVSGLITIAAAVVLAVGSWSVFDQWGLYWSPVPGMGMLVMGSSVLTLVRLRHEEKRKELLKKSFERYVSAQIVNQILRSSKPVNLSGERRTVTVLMSDIRGFTSMSEKMPAEDLVQFLNSYFAAMIDIVLANEGTLDKFMGDAVLVLFGAPIRHDDDPLRAVNVALAMQHKLRELNAQWAARGKPQIRIGIGISTGEVIIGNIGSARRLEYTAIGQDVNYSQRIEDLTKELPSDILINETTYEHVKDHVEAVRYGPINIRGKGSSIYVYGIKGLAGSEKTQTQDLPA